MTTPVRITFKYDPSRSVEDVKKKATFLVVEETVENFFELQAEHRLESCIGKSGMIGKDDLVLDRSHLLVGVHFIIQSTRQVCIIRNLHQVCMVKSVVIVLVS